MELDNPLHRAIIRTVECGGPETILRVGDDAVIQLADRHDGSHLLAGATITCWPEDMA
ncbi:hypothetical protein DAVIS_00390 [Mycobacterium marinum]|uniref:Uncharacterized protein n=1 Tax=Mycobacterium marinum TaxID=1781 RepID=A0A3E2N2R2_MYCMR|nr:hypothetical protein DAVIS_00390 [Mycobacterium marinum]